MNIVCPSCSAVYQFDTSRVPAGGKKVQCSQCNFVFVVRPPEPARPDMQDERTETISRVPAGQSLTGAEVIVPGRDLEDPGDRESVVSRRLILRQDGTRYSVKDMMTLQRWIVERRITREAELSEDGETWEKVGERVDLANFFEMVERSQARTPVTVQAGSASARVGTRIEGVRVVTTLRPRKEDGEEEEDEDALDGEEEDDGLFVIDEDDDEDEVVVGAGVSVEGETPVFDKASLLGGVIATGASAASTSRGASTASASTSPVSTASASTLPTSGAARAPMPTQPVATTSPATPPPAAEASRSKAGAWVWIVVILFLIGGAYAVFKPEPPTTTGPIARIDDPPVQDPGPKGPPLGPDGKPVIAGPPQPIAETPRPVAPTPAPTAAPTPKPTPVPVAVEATPKPKVVAQNPRTPRNPTTTVRNPKPPPVNTTTLSPREAADEAYEQGKALKKQGDLNGAVAAFQRANQMLPTPLFYEEMGFVYLALHESTQKASYLQDAEASFRTAAKRDGSRAGAYLGLGWVYKRQNRLDDAMRAVEACLKRSPDTDTRLEAEGLQRALEERRAMGG